MLTPVTAAIATIRAVARLMARDWSNKASQAGKQAFAPIPIASPTVGPGLRSISASIASCPIVMARVSSAKAHQEDA